jgi:hypothetical protein
MEGTMDPLALPLYYGCAISGALIIAGSLFLLYKQRIYIDSQTKEITAIELPIGVKLRTNAPVLVLFLLGGGLLIYPIVKSELFVREVTIRGGVGSNSQPAVVYVVASHNWLAHGGKFSLTVPALAGRQAACKILYCANNQIVDDPPLYLDDARGGVLQLKDMDVSTLPSAAASAYQGKIASVPPGFERR